MCYDDDMTKEQLAIKIRDMLHSQSCAEEARRAVARTMASTNAEYVRLEREIRDNEFLIGRKQFMRKNCTEEEKIVESSKKKRDKIFKDYFKESANIQTAEDFRKNLLITHSNLPKSSIRLDKTPPEGLERVYTALNTYSAKFPSVKKPNIIMQGATGTGKTFAITALGHELVSRGHVVLYTTAFGMVSRFKDFIFERNDSSFSDMLDADILIIDDMGTEPIIRNITEENLYNLVNERLIAGRAIIITTNLDREGVIERYGDRIASRLFAAETSAVLNLTGVDLRGKK